MHIGPVLWRQLTVSSGPSCECRPLAHTVAMGACGAGCAADAASAGAAPAGVLAGTTAGAAGVAAAGVCTDGLGGCASGWRRRGGGGGGTTEAGDSRPPLEPLQGSTAAAAVSSSVPAPEVAVDRPESVLSRPCSACSACCAGGEANGAPCWPCPCCRSRRLDAQAFTAGEGGERCALALPAAALPAGPEPRSTAASFAASGQSLQGGWHTQPRFE